VRAVERFERLTLRVESLLDLLRVRLISRVIILI
jgi:hypothetical protein